MCDAVPCSHLEELSQLVEAYDVLGIDEGQFVGFPSLPSSLSLARPHQGSQKSVAVADIFCSSLTWLRSARSGPTWVR